MSGLRRYAGVLLAVAAAGVAMALPSPGQATTSIPAPGWQITTAQPTTGLDDGEVVNIVVRANSNVEVNQVIFRECRGNVEYTSVADFNVANGKCPPTAISTSSDSGVVRTTSNALPQLARTDRGAQIPYVVGTGVASFGPDSTITPVTCDQTSPCTLVGAVYTSSGVSMWTQELKFGVEDIAGACGGVSPGALDTGGSDEFADTWAGWSRDYCASKGVKLPTRGSFAGEGAAVSQFAQGQLDVAYTGSGYRADVALTSIPAASRRQGVAVPVAISAAVMAAGGGAPQEFDGFFGDKVAYPNGVLTMTPNDVGAIVAGGPSVIDRLDSPLRPDFFARNAIIGQSVTTPGGGMSVPSGALTSMYLITSYAAALGPDYYLAYGQPAPLAKRTAASNLALAQPPFPTGIYTGKVVLRRQMFRAQLSPDSGPVWTTTDYATANSLLLTLTGLRNADGVFVHPTAKTLQAAADRMKTDDQGMRTPNVKMTAGTSAAEDAPVPYPLTYVIYAMVPAEPLVDTQTCALRTDSQKLLTDWLAYVTGPGQAKLSDGLVPLTPSLQADAQAALAKVGASPVTGPCAGATTAGAGSTGSGPGAPVGDVGGLPASAGVRTNLPVTPAAAAAGATASPAAATGKDTVELAAVPVFSGTQVPATTDGVLGIIGIVLVTSLGVFLTAKVTADGGAVALTGSAGYTTVGGQRRLFGVILLWVGIGLASVGLVIYAVGPLLQQRDQRSLLSHYRTQLKQTAFAGQGLGSDGTNTKAPEIGDPVGVLEIGAVKSQQVVVEGINPTATTKGPGHVPGTAGLGQPGNAVVVARRNAFGGPFAALGDLHRKDKIVVTTQQGQSVYVVKRVADTTLVKKSPKKGETTWDRLLGSSKDDRLTLVTSGSKSPLNASQATVVEATMRDKPFEPTAQAAATDALTSLHESKSSLVPSLALIALLYGAVIMGSVFAYRTFSFRVAYALTLAPLLAVTVVAAETVARILPSWS